MTTVPGRKRQIDHAAVLTYVAEHPTALQAEVATQFGISQCRVSQICLAAGVQGKRRGRPIKPKANLSPEENEWEAILHAHGLGMERGLRIRNQRILYGYDPLRQSTSDHSSTLPTK
jgi:hypothetical protein